MTVKNQAALEKANSDAQLVVSILLGEYGIFARSTENESPRTNKMLGDVVSEIGCIEIQVSEKYENFSLNADKLTQYQGAFLKQIQLDRYFLLGALRPGGKIYCIAPFHVVRDSIATDPNATYYVINPTTLIHSKTVWGDSITNVVRRFMSLHSSNIRIQVVPT